MIATDPKIHVRAAKRRFWMDVLVWGKSPEAAAFRSGGTIDVEGDPVEGRWSPDWTGAIQPRKDCGVCSLFVIGHGDGCGTEVGS